VIVDTERGFEEQVTVLAPGTLRAGIMWNMTGQIAARILNLLAARITWA
jgi:hypothetical protein